MHSAPCWASCPAALWLERLAGPCETIVSAHLKISFKKIIRGCGAAAYKHILVCVSRRGLRNLIHEHPSSTSQIPVCLKGVQQNHLRIGMAPKHLQVA